MLLSDDDDWIKCSIVSSTSVALKKEGALYLWGKNKYKLPNLGGYITNTATKISDKKWIDVGCSHEYIIAIDAKSDIYIMGKLGTEEYSEFTKLMDTSGWKSIESGALQSLFMNNDGEIYGVGDNYMNGLGGRNKEASYDTPVLVTDLNSWGLVDHLDLIRRQNSLVDECTI